MTESSYCAALVLGRQEHTRKLVSGCLGARGARNTIAIVEVRGEESRLKNRNTFPPKCSFFSCSISHSSRQLTILFACLSASNASEKLQDGHIPRLRGGLSPSPACLPVCLTRLLAQFDEFDQFGEMIDEKAAASSSSSSKKSSKSPSTKKGQQLLTPVTIAQVLGAEAIAAGHNQFTIDGKIMSQVAIVGLIMKVEDQQTHETFTIDDSTNQIDVQHYKDKEQNAKQTPFR